MPDLDENADVAGEHIQYHRDGTVWTKGTTLGGESHGFWKWWRKDGTLMRSGTFERGAQVGEWVTYDKSGAPYKVTQMKEKAPGD